VLFTMTYDLSIHTTAETRPCCSGPNTSLLMLGGTVSP
jgi:hypothetical protein